MTLTWIYSVEHVTIVKCEMHANMYPRGILFQDIGDESPMGMKGDQPLPIHPQEDEWG